MKLALLSLVAPLAISACVYHVRKGESVPLSGVDSSGFDWYGDTVSKVVRLNQGWTLSDANWFYWTTQGSQLVPYAFFIALEQPNDQALFCAPRNMLKYRFLAERPSRANPDGLPVGFVADPGSSLPRDLISDRRSLGFTCAACHTAQINFKGTGIRIDGAPAMGDVVGFLTGLTAALEVADQNEAKFERFAQRVLGPEATAVKKTELHRALHQSATDHSAYDYLNHSDVSEGFGRIDAFGRIFNRALTLVDSSNKISANAPVRFPNIWNATRQDFVQWTGVSPNTKLGPLLRNVGELVGVFSAIDPGDPSPSRGYASSVRLSNLRALEHRLKTLKSPAWPEDVLPPINREMAAAGRDLFMQHCERCHHDVGRDSPRHRLITTRVPLSKIGTDPRVAENLVTTRGKTGFLEGTRRNIYVGGPIGHTDTAYHITENTVIHIVIGKLAPHSLNKPMHRVANFDKGSESGPEQDAVIEHTKYEPELQYKAPPLNGVWAAGPYLHNGSVPNLYEVISPPDQRTKQFSVGRREFDPVKVGFVSEPAEGTFQFDTSLEGNRNVGHPFGAHLTEAERWQIVEYLKSI
jgi:mono/diheme cytochrome c family protein